nr:aldo/keto reductase [Sphaerisporangium perillae]
MAKIPVPSRFLTGKPDCAAQRLFTGCEIGSRTRQPARDGPERPLPYPGDLVIATKVGVVRDEWQSWNAAGEPAQLREQVEENLVRLGKDRLDLVYLRAGGDGLMFPGDTPFAESFGTLAELRRRGLIHHLGLSGVTTGRLAEALEIAPVVAVQNRFHIFDRSSADVLSVCEDAGIAFVPISPSPPGCYAPPWTSRRPRPGWPRPSNSSQRSMRSPTGTAPPEHKWHSPGSSAAHRSPSPSLALPPSPTWRRTWLLPTCT